MLRKTTFALALAALATPVLAQDATTIGVAESERYGEYLVTGEGRPVYLFTTDERAATGEDARITCTSEECLEAWPLVTTGEAPRAGEGADADLIGTTDYDGRTVVTYNGWPLYTFVRDAGADAPQGQDIHSFGGEWYLVTPSGEEAHAS
jgi:predicted lipoprotein with Yx(FWY)xxD motif